MSPRYNRRMNIVLAMLGACALLVAGCQRCAEEPPVETAERPERAPVRPNTATIEGVIRLAPDTELPGWASNPMVTPHGRPELPDACPPPQEADRFPVRRLNDDALVGVLVALSEFDTDVPHEPVTHELFIRDCRLTPPMIVGTLGDRLRIVNETDYPFLPDFGGGVMNAVLHGESREVELGRVGVRTLQCGFAASCGRAEVVTQYHPLHTITDEHGRFRIEGVPANETLRVNAWHLLFEDTSEQLTLRPGETRQLEFVLRPKPETPPRRAVEPAEDAPDVLF